MSFKCYFCEKEVKPNKEGNIRVWWHEQMNIMFDMPICNQCSKAIDELPVEWRKEASLPAFKDKVYEKRGLPTLKEREIKALEKRLEALKGSNYNPTSAVKGGSHSGLQEGNDNQSDTIALSDFQRSQTAKGEKLGEKIIFGHKFNSNPDNPFNKNRRSRQ